MEYVKINRLVAKELKTVKTKAPHPKIYAPTKILCKTHFEIILLLECKNTKFAIRVWLYKSCSRKMVIQGMLQENG